MFKIVSNIGVIPLSVLSGVITSFCGMFLAITLNSIGSFTGLFKLTKDSFDISDLNYFDLLFFAPFVESVILIFFIYLVELFTKSRIAIIFSVLFFAILHGVTYWAWAITIIPLFVISLLIFMHMRTVSLNKGFVAVFLIHFVNLRVKN